jgi:hypothetical protein
MTTTSVLAVPGITNLSPAALRALADIADRNGWDADAIVAVMSYESGCDSTKKNADPRSSASGLLQWIDKTARAMFGISAAELRQRSDVEQVGFVERWFRSAFGSYRPRFVDYYLVGWGSSPGRPMSDVLADKIGAHADLYAQNAGLDANKDGQITVADLEAIMRRQQAAAGGRRVPVPDPLASTTAPVPVPAPVPDPVPAPSGSCCLARQVCFSCANYVPKDSWGGPQCCGSCLGWAPRRSMPT